MSVFGIQPTTGDVVAIVSVNGESKVKLFDTANIAVNATQGGGILEFVATFPTVNVNVGDEYKACALLLKDLSKDNLICKTGLNSPAKRAEYVDLSLADTGGKEQKPMLVTEVEMLVTEVGRWWRRRTMPPL